MPVLVKTGCFQLKKRIYKHYNLTFQSLPNKIVLGYSIKSRTREITSFVNL